MTRKDHRLGKIQVKVPHQRSPYAVKFEDRSHEETERQERCAQSKAWDLAKNIYKLKRTTTYILLACRKVGFPSASAREKEKREFVVDSGASVHMVSEKDLNSAELETMITSRSPTTVMTANGEVRTNKEATVQTIGLFRHWHASSRNSRSAFIGETLRRTWVHVSLEKRSKSTSKMARELVAIYKKLCTICGSWNINGFFLNCAFICLVTILITRVNIG